MILHTASEGITLANKLENDSAGFYDELSRRFTQDAETFLSFAKENKKNVAQIQRVYFGVITDALEGSYAFNMNSDDFAIDTTISGSANSKDLLKKALSIEETIIKFYSVAEEQSNCLMADLPRAFMLIAKKRVNRLSSLKTILATIN
jgi:hypothetical protein